MDIELQSHFDQMGTHFLLVKSWLLLFTFQISGMKDYDYGKPFGSAIHTGDPDVETNIIKVKSLYNKDIR